MGPKFYRQSCLYHDGSQLGHMLLMAAPTGSISLLQPFTTQEGGASIQQYHQGSWDMVHLNSTYSLSDHVQ